MRSEGKKFSNVLNNFRQLALKSRWTWNWTWSLGGKCSFQLIVDAKVAFCFAGFIADYCDAAFAVLCCDVFMKSSEHV